MTLSAGEWIGGIFALTGLTFGVVIVARDMRR